MPPLTRFSYQVLSISAITFLWTVTSLAPEIWWALPLYVIFVTVGIVAQFKSANATIRFVKIDSTVFDRSWALDQHAKTLDMLKMRIRVAEAFVPIIGFWWTSKTTVALNELAKEIFNRRRALIDAEYQQSLAAIASLKKDCERFDKTIAYRELLEQVLRGREIVIGNIITMKRNVTMCRMMMIREKIIGNRIGYRTFRQLLHRALRSLRTYQQLLRREQSLIGSINEEISSLQTEQGTTPPDAETTA